MLIAKGRIGQPFLHTAPFRISQKLRLDPVVFHVTYFGVGGATISPGPKWVQETTGSVLGSKPDVVSIHIGENDVRNGCSQHPSQITFQRGQSSLWVVVQWYL